MVGYKALNTIRKKNNAMTAVHIHEIINCFFGLSSAIVFMLLINIIKAVILFSE